jgi:hypothetical protein
MCVTQILGPTKQSRGWRQKYVITCLSENKQIPTIITKKLCVNKTFTSQKIFRFLESSGRWIWNIKAENWSAQTETFPSSTLSTTNPAWSILGLNLGLQSIKLPQLRHKILSYTSTLADAVRIHTVDKSLKFQAICYKSLKMYTTIHSWL